MIIKINDKPLDYTLSNEKTLIEIVAGLEQWLSNSGHRMSEMSVDGQDVNSSMVEEIFKKDINTVKCIEVRTNSIAELTTACIINLKRDIDEYEKLNFDEKAKFFENWKKSGQAQYISEEMPELYSYFVDAFSTGNVSVLTLRSITEEVQREVTEPVKELEKLEPILNEICEKLINLPLNIQTGKDLLAAKTIEIFSSLTEKILRIFYQLNIQGYLLQMEKANKIAHDFSDFKNILTQLLEAYEKHDTIIIGDIAEYEAAPRLKELYFAILDNCRQTAQGEK
ncbi:hypothetical protein R84B8_01988 [Treponema sp. R8-4-B8]